MLKFRWETEFKETEIGEIPRDWGVRKLGNALRSLESGNRPRGGVLAHNPNGVLSIGGENINWDGSLELDDCLRFNESFYYSLRKGKIEVGDVLLVKDGATIGKLAYISRVPEERAMVNEHVFLLKTDPAKFDSRFLFYFLFSEVGQQQIEGSISGSAQGGINKTILDDILVFYPPLSQQSRIATVLSWFDDLIENKRRQNEILEKTAMAIFKSWFIDFEPFRACPERERGNYEFVYNEELGKEIPKGWEVKKIGDVVKFIYGEGLPERNRKEGIYPVVGSSGIVGFHSEYIAEPPTIIIGRKGNAGSVQLFLENSYPIDTVFYSSKHTAPEVIFYIYHLLKIISLEDMALTDTAVPGLNIHMLNSLIIFIPPSHILQSFHSLVEPLFQKIILNQKQIMTLRKIRDTLLPLLVFGKLRVEEI
jgi:type I restriction enzyme S subunit